MSLRVAQWGDYATQPDESVSTGLWNGCVAYLSAALGITGLSLFDITSYKNHGVLTNMQATDWTSGDPQRGGWANAFDGGATEVVAVPDSPSLKFGSGNLTMMLNLYIISVNSGSTDTGFFNKYPVGASSPANYGFFKTDAIDTLEFRCRDSSNREMNPQMTFSLNEWMQLVGVRRGDTAYLYKNGQFQSSNTNSSVTSTDNSHPLHLGRYFTTNGFEGFISNAGVWNRALTDSEIWELFTGGNALADVRVQSPVTTFTAPVGGTILSQVTSSYYRTGA